jgi:signal transduction histidine kinase
VRLTVSVVLLVLLCFIGLCAVVCSTTDAAEKEKTVLLLHTAPRTNAAVGVVEDAFQQQLRSLSAYPVQVYIEYLDLALFSGPRLESDLRDGLRRKYAQLVLDIVVVSSSTALRFAVKHRDELFRDVPIVFTSVVREAVTDPLPSNVTGVWLMAGWRDTAEAALRLHPGTRRLVVLGGTAALDKVWMDAARRQLAAYAGKVDVSFLTELTLNQMITLVRVLPDDAVVLLSSVFRDGAGQMIAGNDARHRVIEASRRPVYTVIDVPFGSGVVGGRLVSFDEHGRAAAVLAARLFAGEHPAPVVASNVAMFDWRQLKRWGIDEHLLPPGSLVQFRQLSIWDRYRWYIAAGISVVLLQTLLTARLLVQRSQLRRARYSLAADHARIRRLAGALMTAQEEERRRLSRDLHDDVSQHVAALAILTSRIKRRALSSAAVGDDFDRLQHGMKDLASQIRSLSHELHPAVLEQAGLVPGLKALIDKVHRLEDLDVSLDVKESPVHVPQDTALCVYRVAQEALHNVAKHAGVDRARVTLQIHAGAVSLTVEDEGRGFDPSAASGLGLVSIEERVHLAGGTVSVTSSAGHGTRVVVRIPIEQDQTNAR